MIYLPRPSAGSASAAFPPAVSALGAFGLSGSKKGPGTDQPDAEGETRRGTKSAEEK